MRRYGLVLAVIGAALALGQSVATDESLVAMRHWTDLKLRGIVSPAPATVPFLRVKSGQILRDRIQDLELLIGSERFGDGLAMRSTGEIDVVLLQGARRFEASLGVDSNDVGYYSNGGRGNVVATVSAGGKELYRSPVLREGMKAIPVSVDLGGARSFTVALKSAGERPKFYQDVWDQADWAKARITQADGSVLRLSDLPTGALAESYVADTAPPFSFDLNKRPSSELLPNWRVERSTRRLDATRTEDTIIYRDPVSGLRVKCVAVSYDRFPVVEWTLYLKNEGAISTRLIENLRAVDVRFEGLPGHDMVLHHSRGSFNSELDFEPIRTVLRRDSTERLASANGRGSDEVMPYFNLDWGGRGAILAVGWPGQWDASFTRDRGNGVRYAAGQEKVHFRLMPGEEVRTPLAVVQFWTGDWIDGQNVWRRWMVAHNLPRTGGELPPPQLSASSGRQTVEMQQATEANQIELMRRTHKVLPIDYWWMDAGWYPFERGWSDVGTWKPDPARFPKGMGPVSKVAHAEGVKTIVWFEPERVITGTELFNEHPEWLLENGRTTRNRLLFLGNPQAWRWLVERVSSLIASEGIDIYRQDFNFEPLLYWQMNDTTDRQGITEIQHITGYLAYFDELRRRFPNLIIDTCASGGRRLDLETLRRAVPLWRSDHPYEPVSMQGQTYGISFWVPYHGTAINAVDSYTFRSQMTPSAGLGFGVETMEPNARVLGKLFEEWRGITKFYNSDFYPLTSWSLDNTAWMGWQFHRPAEDDGVVQVFRRAASPFRTARLPLRGLVPDSEYAVFSVDTPSDVKVLSGKKLMSDGLDVALPTAPSAAIYHYSRKK